MATLYWILLRLSIAWIVVVGLIALVAAVGGAFRGHNWSVPVTVRDNGGPALIVCVLAWIVKPAQ